MNRFKLLYLLTVLLLLCACGAQRHHKKGDQHMAIGEYYEAALEYAKAYSKTPATKKEQRGVLAFKMGESNRLMGASSKALGAYRNALRFKYPDSIIPLHIAELLCLQSDYKNAVKSYEAFIDSNGTTPLVSARLEGARTAAELKARGSSYTVKEDRIFRGNTDDYSPCLFEDQIFFTSTRRDATGDDLSAITGMKNADIFWSKKDDKGKWAKPEPVQGGLNSAYEEGACCLSPDGKTMYLTRCVWDAQYPRMAQIWQSSRSDASWAKPTLCEITKDTLSNFAHPAVSPDGRYLYFVSDMPGGLGGTDIWRAPIEGNGFGAVENLGEPVNTPGDEHFPTFRPNGDLYYSSNGKAGMGGLDIYEAVQDTFHGKWEVTHLPYPVNSNGDDFGMTFEGLHNRGYFASNRSNRRGWDMLYTFDCPEVIQTLKGWVYEQDGYELPKAVVYIVGDDGTNKKVGLKLDGSFDELVKPGVHYLLLATCQGYLNYRQQLYLPEDCGAVDTVLQFPMPSLDIPVLVRNVFYAFDKADILPESHPALERLVALLKQNPTIVIELSSHCDYRGSETYNEALSQRRAESVVKYLTAHGIEPERVVAKGYGKQRPKVITKKFAERYPFLNAGDTLTEAYIKRLPQEQQDTCNALNRRTEFSVLRTNYGLFDAKGNLKPDALKPKGDALKPKE